LKIYRLFRLELAKVYPIHLGGNNTNIRESAPDAAALFDYYSLPKAPNQFKLNPGLDSISINK
jgi:hypothetical protein